jgi:hypothetical protein
MNTNETPGPSGTQPDHFLEDISADELSTNAPADETNDEKNARRERNRKCNEWRRRLHESLPIRNLTEALNQVKSRVHTTPEKCFMSITTIARQAQGMRTGEVLTPKIGTGKELTCGPSLVKKCHSSGKSPQRIR